MAKEKPPILGLIQRGGEVVLQMLANVQQKTIRPIIEATVVAGALIHTDEYDIDARLESWGYRHQTVCHARGVYARDGDGDGVCEVHVNTLEMGWTAPGIDVPCSGSCKTPGGAIRDDDYHDRAGHR